jgi:hypothetical protein
MTDFLIPSMTLFYEKKIFAPLLQPNLAPPKQIPLKFFLKIFGASQAHRKQYIPRHFLFLKKLTLTMIGVHAIIYN